MTTFEPFTFALLRKNGEETPVLVTRMEGKDVYYRAIREDGNIGRETSCFNSPDRIRPAPKGLYHFHIEQRRGLAGGKNKKLWEVSLPNPQKPGEFEPYTEPLSSRAEALRIAQKDWGADSQGRVFIVNGFEKGEEDGRSEQAGSAVQ